MDGELSVLQSTTWTSIFHLFVGLVIFLIIVRAQQKLAQRIKRQKYIESCRKDGITIENILGKHAGDAISTAYYVPRRNVRRPNTAIVRGISNS